MASAVNIILLGETGSGKSTFINYLTNYYLGGGLKDLRVAIPTRYLDKTEDLKSDENAIGDNAKSKTKKCQKYSFVSNEQTYVFIDTPGIGDTGGLQQDTENLAHVFNTVEELHDVTAILLFLNGAQGRHTTNVKHVLTRLEDRLPDNILNNVIVILTNCLSHSVNFEPTKIGLSTNATVFYMQNSAFSSHPNTWEAKTVSALEKNWDASMDVIQKLIYLCGSLSPVSTTTLNKMQQERHQIKSLLHESRVLINQLQQFEDELTALGIALQKYGQSSEEYKNYERDRETTVKHLIDVDYHNTLCSRCNVVCHRNCGLKETSQRGDKILDSCWAIIDSKCTRCMLQCPYELHYHARKEIVVGTKKVREILIDMKNQFESANGKKKDCDEARDKFYEAAKFIEQQLENQYWRIDKICRELKQTCTGFNITDELVLTITFLKRDHDALKSNAVKQRATTFIRRLETLCGELESKQTVNHSTSNEQAGTNRSMASDDEVASLLSKTNTANDNVPLTAYGRDSKNKTVTNSFLSDTSVFSNAVSTPALLPPEAKGIEIMPSNRFIFRETSNEEKQDSSDCAVAASSAAPTVTETKLSRSIITNHEEHLDANPSKVWSEYTVEKLLDTYHTNRDKADRHAIRKELNRRCRGKSIGHLSYDDLMMYSEELIKYQSTAEAQLTTDIRHVADEIYDLTDDDPININKVPKKLLLQLVALKITFELRKNP